MRVTVLGSGSPEPYTRRASSGHLFELDGTKILFDCGGGAVGRLLEAGHDPHDIDHLFFSHLHSDHMLDYARLIHGAWDTADKKIQVFGPAPLAHVHHRLFGADGALAHDIAARTEFLPSQEVWQARGGSLPRGGPRVTLKEISPGFTTEGAGWTLTSCEVPHCQPHLTCMAFRIEAGGRSFVYSGDAGLCDELRTLAQDADLLIHWCYRGDGETVHPKLDSLSPTPSQIADMARAAGVKRLVLTHFRKHMDGPTLTRARDALRDRFGPNAHVAEDLDTWEL